MIKFEMNETKMNFIPFFIMNYDCFNKKRLISRISKIYSSIESLIALCICTEKSRNQIGLEQNKLFLK